MKEVKLYIKDNGNRDFETVRDLLDQIEDDIKWYRELGREEEFLNSKILLQLTDYEGQIVEGKMCLSVGSCEGNDEDIFVVVGNIESIFGEVKK